MMSISELLVILIVAVLVVKPEDVPSILKGLNKLISYVSSLKQEILSYFYHKINEQDGKENQDEDELLFYLERIISIEGQYEGEYDIKHIKAKYHIVINTIME